MWIVLDLIVVAIVAFYVIASVKRGFIKTAVELVGFFLAVYLSFSFSGVVAEKIYTSTVEPKVSESISSAIGDVAQTSAGNVVDNVWNTLPNFVTGVAGGFGVTKESVTGTVQNGVSANNSVLLANQITDAAVKPIVVPIIKTVLGLIIFAVLMIVVKILAKIINKAFNIPIVGSINKALGGVLGAAKGILVAYIVCIVINLFVGLTNGFWCFTNDNIEASKLFSLLAYFSPFGK